MPYLTSLKNNDNWTFNDKLREPGYASFGSYYTILTGMPFSTIFRCNEIMSNISQNNMIGLGDVLNAAGYNQVVVLPSGFAEKDELLEIYNVKYLLYKEDFYNNCITDIVENGWNVKSNTK